jgi:outer membrane protein assembly factor BamA
MRSKRGIFAKWIATGLFIVRPLCFFAIFPLLIAAFATPAAAQNKYEKQTIGSVAVQVSGVDKDNASIEEYRLIASVAVGTVYSTPRIRDAIEAIYNTRRVETVAVTASLNAAGTVDLIFVIKPKTQVQKVAIDIAPSEGDKITEQELLFKLNLLTPGTAITEQTLRNNAMRYWTISENAGFTSRR